MTLPATVPSWIQALNAVATPMIAALVAYVAWRQWQTNRDTLKERLFERRMEVFRETQTYLSEILREAKISDDSIWKFNKTHQNALFLFGPEMQKYLIEIRSRSIDMSSYQAQLEGVPVGSERTKLVEKEHRELKWLIEQLDVIFDRFSPFMSFR
ncbi:MAG: hypothetical protein U1E34_04755 [Amaricoccus sp.]